MNDSIFISIGWNCDPRIFMKWNLNLSKEDGYKSCPFDLCITSYDSLCKTLENNFDTFFDGLQIISWDNADGDRSNAGPGLSCIKNQDGIIFNHEGAGHSHMFLDNKDDDEFYTRNNFQEFKKRYSQRIENFKNYCKDATNITFVYSHIENINTSVIENHIKHFYGSKVISFMHI